MRMRIALLGALALLACGLVWVNAGVGSSALYVASLLAQLAMLATLAWLIVGLIRFDRFSTLRRRVAPGERLARCHQCDYDLRVTTTRRCPECGAKIARRPRAPRRQQTRS